MKLFDFISILFYAYAKFPVFGYFTGFYQIVPCFSVKVVETHLIFMVAKTTPNCLVAIVILIVAYAFWFVKRGC